MPAKTGAGRAPATHEIVVITGLSGSGKGTVLKCLEDLGYYSVDNLPIDLFETFAALAQAAPGSRRAALGVDVREGEALKRFPALFRLVRAKVPARLVFLEADDDALLRRFSETRRPHPLGGSRSVARSIRSERQLLAPIRALADLKINTSKFTVHELREFIGERFSGGRDESKILIYVNSFGFRYGLPHDADLVFDVRFLPNPNYLAEFKNRSGRDPRVARYVRSFQQTQEFMRRISDLLVYLIPHYIREGKSYLTISFGCTGGRHRSVMIADEIRRALARAGFKVKGSHRDIHKP